MTLDEAMKKLAKARKKLKDDQGRVARRNAREKFLRYLRTARQAVDEEYPSIPKKRVSRRKKDPRRQVRGKVTIPRELHRQLLAAGISPAQFVERGKGTPTVWAPKWMKRAYDAGFDPKAIAAAVRSQKKRRKMMTIVRLGAKNSSTSL